MKAWKLTGLVLLLTGVYILSWVNVVYPSVRLSLDVANSIVFVLAQLIPVAIVLLARQRSGWSRWLALTVGILLLLPAVPSGCSTIACVALSFPHDDWFERRQVVQNDRGVIAVYRTNGGATTAFGIVVRQECRLVPGLLIVRQLAHEYPADQADVQFQSPGSVEIRFEDGSDQPPHVTTREFHLRNFCWGGIVQ